MASNFRIEIIGVGDNAAVEEKARAFVSQLGLGGAIRAATLQAEGKVIHLDRVIKEQASRAAGGT